MSLQELMLRESSRRSFLIGVGTAIGAALTLGACDIIGGGKRKKKTSPPVDNPPVLTYLSTSNDNWDRLYATFSGSDDNGLNKLNLVFDNTLGVNTFSIDLFGMPNPANMQPVQVDIASFKPGFYSGEGKLYDSANQPNQNGVNRFAFTKLGYNYQTSIKKTLDELVQSSPIVETISKADWNSAYNLNGTFSASLEAYLNSVVNNTQSFEAVKNIRILGTNEADVRLLVEYEALQGGQVIGRTTGETYHAEISLDAANKQELFDKFIRDHPPNLTFLGTSDNNLNTLSVTYSASDDNGLNRLDLVFDDALVNAITIDISARPNPAVDEAVNVDVSAFKPGFYAGEGKLYDSAGQSENTVNRFTFAKLGYTYQKSIKKSLDELVVPALIAETISKTDWDAYNAKELFNNTPAVKTYLDDIAQNTAAYETIKSIRVAGTDETNMRLIVEYQVNADNQVIGINNGGTYFAEVDLDNTQKQELYGNFVKVLQDSYDAPD